ncbi:MAG: hypothetical protein P4L16_01160 [Chlamydiales bacterium]|nr:hypothetical protein [Chlamydiales bacterium]
MADNNTIKEVGSTHHTQQHNMGTENGSTLVKITHHGHKFTYSPSTGYYTSQLQEKPLCNTNDPHLEALTKHIQSLFHEIAKHSSKADSSSTTATDHPKKITSTKIKFNDSTGEAVIRQTDESGAQRRTTIKMESGSMKKLEHLMEQAIKAGSFNLTRTKTEEKTNQNKHRSNTSNQLQDISTKSSTKTASIKPQKPFTHLPKSTAKISSDKKIEIKDEAKRNAKRTRETQERFKKEIIKKIDLKVDIKKSY